MRTLIITFSLGLAAFVTSCTSTPDVKNQPALLLPTGTSLETLTKAVSMALHGRSVTLMPDSFTKRSTLIMDPVFATGPDGNPVMGRSTQRPDHFNLMKRGQSCVLIHEETGKETILDGVACVLADI